MASQKAPFCTDEELLHELKKLGYNDVSPDVFQMMKNDLTDLVEKEQYSSECSGREEERSATSTVIRYTSARKKYGRTIENLSEKLKSQSIEGTHISSNQLNSDTSPRSSDCAASEDPYSKYRNRFKHLKIGNLERRQARVNSSNPVEGDSTEVDDKTLPNCISRQYSKERNIFKEMSSKLPEIITSESEHKGMNSDRSLSNSSPFNKDLSEVNYSINKYRDRFKSLKINSFGSRQENVEPCEKVKNDSADAESELSFTSLSVSRNKMKRKVLKYKDGKPVITEVFLDIPNVFDTSYPETESLGNSKSFSSSDLSWNSNGSTGSISALSPDTFGTSLSTYSLSSPRSLHSRFTVQRKKKNDPVAMYNYYKKYWNNFKPPGEKTHDKLRWAVRDKMLDYNL